MKQNAVDLTGAKYWPRREAASDEGLVQRVLTARDQIEPLFHDAGERLSRTADVLAQTKGPLQSLSELVGGGQIGLLRQYADLHHQNQSGLAAELAGAIVGIEDLEAAARNVHAAIELVERIVLTMKFVVINARMIVATMPNASASLEFFTTGATGVVAESAKLLGNLDQTMMGLVGGAREARSKSETLVKKVAANANFATDSLRGSIDGFNNYIVALSKSGGNIARQTDDLLSATGLAVAALQIGDTTRQRLEHIATIFQHADRVADPTSLNALGFAQLRDTAQHHATGVDALKRNAQALEFGVLSLFKQHLQPFASAKDGAAAELIKTLELIDATVGDALEVQHALKDHIHKLEEYPTALQKLISEGDSFAESIQLIGINAVIVCAAIGENGRALKHISLELQNLAADAARGLQGVKDGLSNISHCVGRISAQLMIASDAAQKTPAGSASSLRFTIDAIGELVAGAQSIAATTQQCFTRDRIAFGPLEWHCECLLGLAKSSADAGEGAGLAESERGILDEIWAIYTMNQERIVHQGVFGALEESVVSEDVDSGDIFF